MSKQKKYYIPGFGKIKMMDVDNFYLHATGGILGRHIEKNCIINILTDGEIKTRENTGIKAKSLNQDNELCLWDPKIKFKGINKFLYLSSINNFITEGPCLVLSRDINTFRPTVKVIIKKEEKETCIGITDIYDEVRHQGNIPLDYLEFIAFPIEKPKKMRTYRDELFIYKKEISLIKRNFPDIKVKDIFTGNDLNEESITNKIEELEQKQYRKMVLHSLFRR